MRLDRFPGASGHRSALWRAAWCVGLALSLGLHACGGGGVEGGGTGVQPAYTQGSISGFGSIVVNGVHYDERSARVSDDDGNVLTAAELQLGMVVNIDSTQLDTTALTATATDVQVASHLIGPVSAKSAASSGSTLTVLGQTVSLSQATVFDTALTNGLAGLSLGQVVEVHAIYDPVTGVYAARRVQLRANASSYKIRGVVHALNTSTGVFQIGTESFVYTRNMPPSGLAEGALLRFKLKTQKDSLGRWQVSTGELAERRPGDGATVVIESVIGSYSSLSQFSLAGLQVDASAASLSLNGMQLGAGKRVEVQGRMSGPVLKASKLEIKGSEDSGSSSGAGGGAQPFEIAGIVSSLDTNQKTLVIRTATVSYASASFVNGSVADLANGKSVSISGTLAAGGTVVKASQIRFGDFSKPGGLPHW